MPWSRCDSSMPSMPERLGHDLDWPVWWRLVRDAVRAPRTTPRRTSGWGRGWGIAILLGGWLSGLVPLSEAVADPVARPAGAALTEMPLVYSVLRDGRWRLYWQADETAPPRPLAPLPGDQLAARLSTDGRRVAFEITGKGLAICALPPVAQTAETAGEVPPDDGCRSLPNAGGDRVRPVWHPVSGELLWVRFVVGSGEERSQLEIAAPDLSQIRPVLDQSGIQDFPDLAPSGRRLAYTSWQTVMPFRGGVQVIQQLWSLDLATGQAGQLLLSNASDIHPRWSPDGQRLAFASNRTGRYEIWTIAADGQDPRQVTAGPGQKTWPAWSPDGTRILFNHERDGRSGLAMLSLASGEMRHYQPFGADAEVQIRDPDW